MTDELEQVTHSVASPAADAVLMQAQQSGKLPIHWWTSEPCWRMLAKLAGQFANSTMVPSAYRNEPGNVIVALAAGMPLGLAPLACLQSVAVINGRPTLYGDAPIAQVLAHPSFVGMQEHASGDINDETRVWSVTVTRKTPQGHVTKVTRTFGVEDAKRASLWKKSGPWQAYPDRMLYNRARAYAVRDGFADVLQGVQIAADSTDDVQPAAAAVETTQTVVTQDTVSLTSSVTNSEQVEAPAAEKPKAKRKRRRSERAAEAAHAAMQQQETSDAVFALDAADDAKQQHVSSDALPIAGFTLEEPRAHCVSFDAESSSVLWFGDDERSIVIEADHAQHEQCLQAVRDGLTRFCVQQMQSRRMSSEDAGLHVQEVLRLDRPHKLAELTHTQLADLARDLR